MPGGFCVRHSATCQTVSMQRPSALTMACSRSFASVRLNKVRPMTARANETDCPLQTLVSVDRTPTSAYATVVRHARRDGMER